MKLTSQSKGTKYILFFSLPPSFSKTEGFDCRVQPSNGGMGKVRMRLLSLSCQPYGLPKGLCHRPQSDHKMSCMVALSLILKCHLAEASLHFSVEGVVWTYYTCNLYSLNSVICALQD